MGNSALLSVTCTIAVVAWAAPALAQAGPGAGEGEIIVTARKREETLLQVPVVATVIASEQLERQQLSSITDIATKTPGLSTGLSVLELGTQISIRGVGTSASDPGIEQSAALVLDGLQITAGPAFSVGSFDMAQVEVLKGPQALFYGKSSPAGVIAIRTADPGEEFETLGRIGYESEAREWRAEAILSTPLTQSLGVRVAGMYSDYGGFFKNSGTPIAALGAVGQPRRFGQTKTIVLRGTVLFKPTAEFSARLKVNYSRDKMTGGAAFQFVSCPDGLAPYTGIPFIGLNDKCRADRFVDIVDSDPAAYGGLDNDGKGYTNIKQRFGTLELNYDLQPELTLTSLTGYYKLNTDALLNASTTGAAGGLIIAQRHLDRRDMTQELRLNSDFSGPLDFTAGAFYQDGKIFNSVELASNTRIGFPPRLAIGTYDIDIVSKSLFGQLRYEVASAFEIAAGVRWTDEKRTARPVSVDLFGLVTGVPGNTFPVPQRTVASKNWSPELTLTYTPSDTLTIFGSLKQAYKSGSFNTGAPAEPGARLDYGDEKVRGGEIGLKSRLADRQVYLEVAGYYYKYTGLQVGANESSQGGNLVILRTINAGGAEVYGVDLNISYQPVEVPGLSLHAAVNWNHARFTKLDNVPCYGGQTIALGCDRDPQPASAADIAAGYFVVEPGTGRQISYKSADLSGTPLPRAPDWQINAGIDYEMPVGKGMTLRVGADGEYSSKYPAGLVDRPSFYQRGFVKINANLSLGDDENAWEVALIGKNLTNKLTTGFCATGNYAGGYLLPGVTFGNNSVGPGGSDETQCIFSRGRELWLRLTLRPNRF